MRLPKNWSVEDLKRILEEKAEKLLELAGRLTDQGKPMSSDEKHMLRDAMSSIVAEHFDETLWFFVRGNKENFESSCAALYDRFIDFL